MTISPQKTGRGGSAGRKHTGKANGSKVSRIRLAKGLILFSAMVLAGGLYYPIAARIYDSYLGYGIIFVSFPCWTLGAIAGSGAAYIAHARYAGRSIQRWAGVVAVLNIAAIALIFVVPFHAS